jgi:hypothetical protein
MAQAGSTVSLGGPLQCNSSPFTMEELAKYDSLLVQKESP